MMKVLLLPAFLASPVSGLIFFEGPSPVANSETAPMGDYAGAGWQHQIVIDREATRILYFGTIISPKHFMTAAHLAGGAPGTDAVIYVRQPSYLTGGAERVYTMRNSTRPSSIRYTEEESGEGIATDFHIYEIWETFPDFAELYTPSDGDEEGKEFVITGFGDIRGAAIVTGEKEHGWGPDDSDRRGRWGTNRVDGTARTKVDSSQGLLLYCDFDAIGGADNPLDPGDADATPYECQAAGKDSGGGWFIKSGGTWKLAGINYAVDSYTKTAGGGGQRWAIYDGVGLYSGGSATPIAPCTVFKCDFYRRAHTYATRVSEHVAAIDTIIQPAKDTALLSPTGKFDRWAQGYGLAPGTSSALDSDRDGLSNLEEYLAESDPNDPSEKVPPFSVDLSGGATHRFQQIESLDLDGRGLAAVIERSNNLLDWSPVTGLTEDSDTVDHLKGSRTRDLSVAFGGTGAVYYRLKITL